MEVRAARASILAHHVLTARSAIHAIGSGRLTGGDPGSRTRSCDDVLELPPVLDDDISKWKPLPLKGMNFRRNRTLIEFWPERFCHPVTVFCFVR